MPPRFPHCGTNDGRHQGATHDEEGTGQEGRWKRPGRAGEVHPKPLQPRRLKVEWLTASPASNQSLQQNRANKQFVFTGMRDSCNHAMESGYILLKGKRLTEYSRVTADNEGNLHQQGRRETLHPDTHYCNLEARLVHTALEVIKRLFGVYEAEKCAGIINTKM
jgi:hypothetical protein